MKTLKHPSEMIAPGLAKALRAVAADAEQMKQLHPAQLDIIYDQNWFRLFVPGAYNGLALTLPEGLQLEEALAWTDGSVGWTVTLCSGAGWFAGFLDQQPAAAVFNDKKVCLAGSGKSTGIATIIDEGYEVTGYWDYATGSTAATAFTANCVVEESGMPLRNADGSPLIRSFLFFKNEVTILETQQLMGMVATGSHSFGVKKIRLNKNRTFVIDQQHTVLADPIYQFPFLQFAETTLAVNSCGMALRFLDLCKSLVSNKSTPAFQSSFTNAQKEIDAARELFYDTVNSSWLECCRGLAVAPESLQQLSCVSKKLAVVSRKIVDELYPYCGMQAANPGTEINRVWRNLHTASQHSLFNR